MSKAIFIIGMATVVLLIIFGIHHELKQGSTWCSIDGGPSFRADNRFEDVVYVREGHAIICFKFKGL